MSDEQNTPDRDKVVAIVNSDARIYNLSRYLDVKKDEGMQAAGVPIIEERPTERLPILPGLNFLPLEFLQAVRFKTEDYQGRVRAVDIADVPSYQAQQIASVTTSRAALHKWLGMEQRPEVRESIEARLASKKVK